MGRTRFILLVTILYTGLALGWILLSDRLLLAMVTPSALAALSTAKGLFFVVTTAALLFLALRAVPPEGAPPALTLPVPRTPWQRAAMYGFALAITAAMIGVRASLPPEHDHRLLLILYILPVILSALIGGIGPGLAATATAALAVDLISTPKLHSSAASPLYQVQWALFILDGIAVSALSEMLQRSVARSEHHQRQARASEERMKLVIEATSDGVWDFDLVANSVYLSPRCRQLLGVAPDAVLDSPKSVHPYVHADDLPSSMRRFAAHLDGRTPALEFDFRLTAPALADQWLLARGRVVTRDGSGRAERLVGTLTDITERKQHELAQREAGVVFESSYEGIVVVDPEGRITKVNPAFSRITGYAAEEVIGHPPSLLASGQHGPSFYQNMWQSLFERGFWRGEIWNRRKSGEVYAELLSISAVRDDEGKIRHFIGVFSDINHLKLHEAELDRVAHYDPLTGLPNRRLLSERLNRAIVHASRTSRSAAVCFLDLDGFKSVNDDYGHTVGDQLLVGVAGHLKNVLRADDTLARLAGDEFVIILSDIASPEECTTVLDRLLDAVSQEVQAQGLSIRVSASIGVSLYPADDVDADTLLRHADQAMVQAKESGKNRYQLFDPESDRKAQTHRRFVEQLRQALAHREFELFYQPKVDLATGDVVGAEALIRWRHPERGLLSPAEFLPHVQGSELETSFGEWVIETALSQLADWSRQGLTFPVSVNVSANHLLQPEFVPRLAQALARHPELPPARFELEVVETAAIGDMQQAIEILQRCRQLGVAFSLDDFGTGYSSLTYLRKLPVDTLKIDQSFVRDMLVDVDDLGIVDGVIQLAGVFHRKVIAEGVETMEHGAMLQRLGCRLAQGYGIAQPMPAQRLPAWCAEWGAGKTWLQASPSVVPETRPGPPSPR